MKNMILIYICILAISSSVYAQDVNISKVDAMIREYLAMDLFSGNVLISEAGIPVYEKSFGFSNKEEQIKNQIDTKFNFGSIGKLFTGTLILKLAEKGDLNLDDNIGKYIDYFPDDILNKVTIRHLLRHQAGFGDYLSSPKFAAEVNNLGRLSDLIELFKDEPLLFEPGTGSRYSNSGYAVLGAVIEAATNKSFYSAMEDMILNPLHLNDTHYSTADQVRGEISNYIRTLQGEVKKTIWHGWPSPAGGEFTTVGDLNNFIQSIIYSDKILNDSSKKLLLNRFDDQDNRSLAEIISDERATPIWAGGAPGISAAICQFLNKNITIVVLSNYDSPIAITVAESIRSIILNGTYTPPKFPLSEYLYKNYKEKGGDYIKNKFEELTSGYLIRGPKHLILNQIGYDLLREQNINEAIGIFLINTTLFPNEVNTHDSLAEAYVMAGKLEDGMREYKKVLELDPQNANAVKVLKELQNAD